MKISLSPIRMDADLTVERSDDTITLNGEAFDFSVLPEGATLPRDAIASAWFAGDVRRDDAGVLHIPLVLPISASSSDAARFPAVLSIDANGPIALPE